MKRLKTKTVTFGIMHICIAFMVVWAMTGSPWIGGAVALVEPMINTIGYFFHEKVWLKLETRRTDSIILTGLQQGLMGTKD